MTEIADDLWQLAGFPAHAFNIYLAGDVLIDCGTRWARRRVLRQLRGRALSLVALTHCHPDHQGTARLLCERYGVPLACHEADVAAMEGRARMVPPCRAVWLGERFWSGPPYPVGRVLHDGDTVGSFRVVHAPGHTPGQVIYFREADRVAVAGDVLLNMNMLNGRPGLHEPIAGFCVDIAQNRVSIRRLRELRPALVCFGHGPPLREPELLDRFVERLP